MTDREFIINLMSHLHRRLTMIPNYIKFNLIFGLIVAVIIAIVRFFMGGF